MYKKGKGVRAKEVDATPVASGDDEKKKTGGLLRLTSDFTDLDVPSGLAELKRDPTDPMRFAFVITPNEGYWRGGKFEFQLHVLSSYPFKAPELKCLDKIYHPNITTDGGVCVSVMRPWKASNTVQMILFGLLFLFTDPNPMDVLREEKGFYKEGQEPDAVLRRSPAEFARNVTASMRGESVGGVSFPRNRGLPGR